MDVVNLNTLTFKHYLYLLDKFHLVIYDHNNDEKAVFSDLHSFNKSDYCFLKPSQCRVVDTHYIRSLGITYVYAHLKEK